MFAKRKYNRKSSRRKGFKKRVRRKSAILRPKASLNQPTPPVPVSDFDASVASPYNWQFVEPDPESPGHPPSRGVPTLKSIAARQVALNAHSLDSHHFAYGSWTCWSTVWNHVLAMRLDLPHLFRVFYKTFGADNAFKCHWRPSHLPHPATHRDIALSHCLLPRTPHRIDNLFTNVVHLDIPRFFALLGAHVVVDCSNNNLLSRNHILNLCNIQNLVALDLSGLLQVDHQFLYTIMQALMAKNSASFRLLRLVNCPNMSLQGLLRLLQDDNILSALPFAYLETDVCLVKGSTFASKLEEAQTFPVDNTQWLLLNETSPETARLAKYSLAMKCHHLSQNMHLLEFALPFFLWDLKIFQDTIDVANRPDSTNKHIEAWEKRNSSALMKPAINPYCYVRTHREKHKSPPKLQKIKTEAPVGRAQVKVAKKPRLVSSNPNQFFRMN